MHRMGKAPHLTLVLHTMLTPEDLAAAAAAEQWMLEYLKSDLGDGSAKCFIWVM